MCYMKAHSLFNIVCYNIICYYNQLLFSFQLCNTIAIFHQGVMPWLIYNYSIPLPLQFFATHDTATHAYPMLASLIWLINTCPGWQAYQSDDCQHQ